MQIIIFSLSALLLSFIMFFGLKFMERWERPPPSIEEVCIAYIQELQTCQQELGKMQMAQKQAAKKKKKK